MVKREYSFYPLTVCGVRGTSKSKRYGKEGPRRGEGILLRPYGVPFALFYLLP